MSYALRTWDGGISGLGVLDYNDLLRKANLQNCDPMDSTCVSNNVAKQAAVEDLWATKYQATGAPDDLILNFTPQTAAQVREFYNPENMVSGGNVVDTRGIMTASVSSQPKGVRPPVAHVSTCGDPPQIRLNWVAGVPIVNSEDVTALANWSKCTGIKSTLPPLPTGPPPSSTLAPASKHSAPTAATTSTGAKVKGAPDFTASFVMPDFSQGFSFSAIPWWMWAGGAVAAYFVLGGKR